MKKIITIGVIAVGVLIIVIFFVARNKPYHSEMMSISFLYPTHVFVREVPGSIILVEDTQENRDVLDGKIADGREGPVAITIERIPTEVFSIPSFWHLEKPGVYLWSGLYEGKSIIRESMGYTYVFSVTWMTKEDQLLRDFETVIRSTTFKVSQP